LERIVISHDEIAQTTRLAEEPIGLVSNLPAPIPVWARLSLFPLILVLPVLCLVTILLRVATRGLPPRSRFAWVAFLSTLLSISGILTTIVGVAAFSLAPTTPSVASQGLSELDSKSQFPALPAPVELNAEAISDQLKPLVTVISPAQKNWFSHVEGPSNVFGAGVLLQANNDGYLIATARHVVDAESASIKGQRALVASSSGTWAGADVVARHDTLDLALLWLPRRQGQAAFTLPVVRVSQLKSGEPIYDVLNPHVREIVVCTRVATPF
jgi:S1-C subfamily serine protease